jgi:hypothetical protein
VRVEPGDVVRRNLQLEDPHVSVLKELAMVRNLPELWEKMKSNS